MFLKREVFWGGTDFDIYHNRILARRVMVGWGSGVAEWKLFVSFALFAFLFCFARLDADGGRNDYDGRRVMMRGKELFLC